MNSACRSGNGFFVIGGEQKALLQIETGHGLFEGADFSVAGFGFFQSDADVVEVAQD